MGAGGVVAVLLVIFFLALLSVWLLPRVFLSGVSSACGLAIAPALLGAIAVWSHFHGLSR